MIKLTLYKSKESTSSNSHCRRKSSVWGYVVCKTKVFNNLSKL